MYSITNCTAEAFFDPIFEATLYLTSPQQNHMDHFTKCTFIFSVRLVAVEPLQLFTIIDYFFRSALWKSASFYCSLNVDGE